MADAVKFDYSSPEWRALRARALARDGRKCTVSRLLGGRCHGLLHVHHIIPVEDGGPPLELDNTGTACARHHPRWEALRRRLARSVEIELPCPECAVRCGVRRALTFRTVDRLEEHRRNVHHVGVPVPDWPLNRRMAADLLERLRTGTLAQAA